jgi:hypothetical protein
VSEDGIDQLADASLIGQRQLREHGERNHLLTGSLGHHQVWVFSENGHPVDWNWVIDHRADACALQGITQGIASAACNPYGVLVE